MWLFNGRKPEPAKLDLTQTAIRPFDTQLVYNHFDCGREPLNRFLKNKAKNCARRLEHRVFCATLNGSPSCIGYYALQLGSDTVPDDFKKKQHYIQNHTAFPAVHLSFLAVAKPYQGQGLGRFLLMDVLDRAARILDHAGFYALTLQSIDADATSFYKKLGFEEYSQGGGQPKMLYPVENIVKLFRIE